MGKPKSPEHRAKIAEALRGKPKSAEARAKMVETWERTREARLPIVARASEASRAVNRDRIWSDESRQKLSASKRQGRSLEDRFWSKVDRRSDDECWEWQGGRKPFGYGVIVIGSRTDGTRHAAVTHRVAWELTYGPIEDGMKVLHHCDNPPCCNPNHLFLGTQVDNIADMDTKGRARRIGGAFPEQRGESHPSAKLAQSQVDEIRHRYAAGGISQDALAREYGVNQTTISTIVRGKHWH